MAPVQLLQASTLVRYHRGVSSFHPPLYPLFASYVSELNSSLKFVGRNMVTEILHYLYWAYQNH